MSQLKMEHNLVVYGLILAVLRVGLSTTTVGNCRIDSGFRQGGTSIDCYSKKWYSLKCDHLSLSEVPKSYPEPPGNKSLCSVDLSWNNFHVLKNDIFVNAKNLNTSSIRSLYLDNSNLSYISSNAFVGLSSLLFLNITRNNLIWPSSFGKGVFKPLPNLEYLHMKGNDLSSFDGLGQELGHMKNLEGLYAVLCANCSFGKEFEQLPRLVNLSLSGCFCNVPVVKNNTFEGLTHLKRLWLSSCKIEKIEANAFRPLNGSLELLDISYNEHLNFTGLNTALYSLRHSSKLEILSVNRIHYVHGLGVELKVTDVEHLSSLRTLSTLHMDLNKIEILEKGVLSPTSMFPTSLRVLTLSSNRLSFGEYAMFLSNAMNITCLDISRQHLYYDPFHTKDSEYEITRADSINADGQCLVKTAHVSPSRSSRCSCPLCFPPNLRRLKWRKSFLNIDNVNVTICGASQLTDIDLSFNLLSKWRSSIRGLETLERLDLSENYCSEVASDFFDNFKNLQHLNISGNKLGVAFGESSSSNKSKGIFKSLAKLITFDLSHNRIERFSDVSIFKGLSNLQYLYLHSNILRQWHYSMPKSYSLKRLDLSLNKLSSLPNRLTSYLDKLCQSTSNCSVTLLLNDNPIECSCQTLPFLKWMMSTKVRVQRDECRFNSDLYDISSNEKLRYRIAKLEKEECPSKSWITWTIGTLCTGIGCFTSIVVCVLVYKYRWKLRYIYYSRNRRFNHEGFDRLFENDAFVSYSKNNTSFIKSCMVPSLEQHRGLRLWAADRNSLPGTSIAENIAHGICNSRKSVLLVNREYLKDSWCSYEMNMAQVESTETNRKLLIIVLMETIPLENLPIDIMRFLRSERSLEFPERGQDMDTFWTNLADEIMS